jgi:uncharacterized heparinase superfamily protein
MNKQTFIRYATTIKYLRLQQIYYRLYYFLKKPSLKSLPIVFRRIWPLLWTSPLFTTSSLSMDGTWSCLSKSDNIYHADLWNSSRHAKLWLYHLHYFDALNVTNLEAIHSFYIDTWIAHNPPAKGNGWEAYPLSLRIVNWIKCFARTDIDVSSTWLASLMLQVSVLMQKIEYHILGNHLFVNGKALIFAGAFFSGVRAEKWLHKGLKIIDREIQEQFLADGGHFELSPMYHANVLWDVCDLLNLAKITQIPELIQRMDRWQEVIGRGLDWLTCMIHPDGKIAFFNDAAFDMAPTLQDLVQYASQLDILWIRQEVQKFDVQLLQNTGYGVIYLPDHGRAILDLAPVGPDYQPGHAHADTLSFELSLYGQRCLVNSGISQYGQDEMRLLQRSTKAHNTICVNDKNSSDVWSGFRVAKRAYPFNQRILQENDTLMITCSHDGYMKTIHQRTWSFTPKSLLLIDTLQGENISAEARFYFHPDVCMIKRDDRRFEGQIWGEHRLSLIFEDVFEGSLEANLESSFWYPGFGQSLANQCIVVKFYNNELKTHWTW